MVNFEEKNHKQNYLGANKQVAISSYGEIYEVGEEVGNTSNELDSAVIISFEFDESTVEVKATTTMGWQHLDFLRKI